MLNKLKMIKLEGGYHSYDKAKEIDDVIEQLKLIDNEMPIFDKFVHPNGRKIKIRQILNDYAAWMNLDRYDQDLMIIDINNIVKEVNQWIEQFREDANVKC